MPVTRSDKDRIVLDFHTGIYTRASVMQALRDFQGVCMIDSKEDGDRMLVTLTREAKDEPADLENVGYELYNYVLGLMKNRAEV
jgi:hypothetical protein